MRKANSQQKYGCGNNKKGAGFSLNADYYEYYCPLAAMLPSFPYKCEGIPGGDFGKTTLTPDTGTEQNLTKLLTEGFILSFLLLMISFFALLAVQAKDRRRALWLTSADSPARLRR